MDAKNIVTTYFEYLAAIHAGEEAAVEQILDLFDDEASWEILGPHPLVGEFKGRLALEVLFRNLTQVGRLTIRLGERRVKVEKIAPVEVTRQVELAGRFVADWTQEVRIGDREGIVLDGSTTFYLKDGKIARLRSVAMPRRSPEALPPGLSIEELTVSDIGRLALAAWAVV